MRSGNFGARGSGGGVNALARMVGVGAGAGVGAVAVTGLNGRWANGGGSSVVTSGCGGRLIWIPALRMAASRKEVAKSAEA